MIFEWKFSVLYKLLPITPTPFELACHMQTLLPDSNCDFCSDLHDLGVNYRSSISPEQRLMNIFHLICASFFQWLQVSYARPPSAYERWYLDGKYSGKFRYPHRLGIFIDIQFPSISCLCLDPCMEHSVINLDTLEYSEE